MIGSMPVKKMRENEGGMCVVGFLFFFLFWLFSGCRGAGKRGVVKVGSCFYMF